MRFNISTALFLNFEFLKGIKFIREIQVLLPRLLVIAPLVVERDTTLFKETNSAGRKLGRNLTKFGKLSFLSWTESGCPL